MTKIQHQDYAICFLRAIRDQKIKYPLLLVGPDGVGKLSSVRSLAAEMWCEKEDLQSCDCPVCFQLEHNIFPDFTLIRPEGAFSSIKIEIIQELVESCQEMPAYAQERFIVIDDVEALTTEASETLLKIVEEPPRHIRFFFLSSKADRIRPTIRSRCGQVQYNSLPRDFVAGLVEKFTQSQEDASLYAKMGRGSAGMSIQYGLQSIIQVRNTILEAMLAAQSKKLLHSFSLVDNLEVDNNVVLELTSQLATDALIARSNTTEAMVHTDRQSDILQLSKSKTPEEWCSWVYEVMSLPPTSKTFPFQLKASLASLAK